MKKYIWNILLFGMPMCFVGAQSTTFKAVIFEAEHGDPLPGATVYFEILKKGSNSDLNGLVTINEIPVGQHHVRISFIGYEILDTLISVQVDMEPLVFSLHESGAELDEVVVKATRSTRTIQNIPTRIELIGGEELGEKAMMRPANISMVLQESTGIQIQQTSLSSANSSIRIQGLDGRYTQLLKDGFPLYGGFSGGLSIMQIPPLDLQQFEIIKGSASTLYGGGAIAGLVNMVSKTPGEVGEKNLELMLTQTHALGSTANLFYSERLDKIGYTLYGSGHLQKAYDPDGNDFSNLPETRTLSFNPKLFWYPSESAQLWFGLNGTYDHREGGDMQVLRNQDNGAHEYSEINRSFRFSTQAVYEQAVGEDKSLQVKNSIAFFDRLLETPEVGFLGKQWNTFTEANFGMHQPEMDWIFGVNLYSNSFREHTEVLKRDQKDITFGAFANLTRDLSPTVALDAGLRTDHATDWGTFFLPRVSLLWKINDRISSRLGAGLGYKIPDIFTEEAAMLQFQDILPIDRAGLDAEQSYGLNLDLHYKTILGGKVGFSFNQLFYMTFIENAILLNSRPDGLYEFVNAGGYVRSKGAETNIKFTFGDFRWFLNYAFINATLNYLPGNPQKPLTPRHNAGMVLMYENEQWRIGLETYYTGPQRLSTGTTTRDYALMGLLLQKHFEWGSPFVNFENFTDRRQSRFSPEVLPPHGDPIFPEIYMPTDGFIFSLGIMIQPFGGDHHEH